MTRESVWLRARIRIGLTALLIAAVCPRALLDTEAPVVFVSFSSHGDAMLGSSGAPLVLTSTTILVPAEGPDGDPTTQDDLTLVVRPAAGGTFCNASITPLATPFASARSGQVTRLSATSALRSSAGDDRVWGTNDDAVHLLSQIGTLNIVSKIIIRGGSLPYSPERTSSSTAVTSTTGLDGVFGTADDCVAVLSGLGATSAVEYLPAPFIPESGRSRPVPLSSSSFLVASDGLDGIATTADDVTYLFTDVGGEFQRVDLATPFLFDRAPGRAVAASRTRAIASSAADDGLPGTSDDEILLLDSLDAVPTVTRIGVESLTCIIHHATPGT